MPVSGGDQVDRDGCRTRPAHHAKIGRGLTEHHAEASSCAGRFAVQGCPVAVKGIPSNARRESKIFTLLRALSLSGKGPYRDARRAGAQRAIIFFVRCTARLTPTDTPPDADTL